MKKLLLLLVLTCTFYCTTYAQDVIGLNGVFYKQGNTTVVNLGWTVPNNQTVFSYIVKRNGLVVRTLQAIGFVQVSIPVEREYRFDIFSVVCNNREYFTTVRR